MASGGCRIAHSEEQRHAKHSNKSCFTTNNSTIQPFFTSDIEYCEFLKHSCTSEARSRGERRTFRSVDAFTLTAGLFTSQSARVFVISYRSSRECCTTHFEIREKCWNLDERKVRARTNDERDGHSTAHDSNRTHATQQAPRKTRTESARSAECKCLTPPRRRHFSLRAVQISVSPPRKRVAIDRAADCCRPVLPSSDRNWQPSENGPRGDGTRLFARL